MEDKPCLAAAKGITACRPFAPAVPRGEEPFRMKRIPTGGQGGGRCRTARHLHVASTRSLMRAWITGRLAAWEFILGLKEGSHAAL